MLSIELSQVMVSKNTVIGSGSLSSSLVSSSSCIIMQVDLLSLVFWALHNFMHLLEAFLNAYFLEVPCFHAVCALGICGWTCGATFVSVSTSEATADYKFELWFAGG